MSDLISREAVLAYINSHKEFTVYTENGISKSTNNYVNAALLNGFISNLHSAYDVDKVLEKLEQTTCENLPQKHCDDYMHCDECMKAACIAVVKKVVESE